MKSFEYTHKPELWKSLIITLAFKLLISCLKRGDMWGLGVFGSCIFLELLYAEGCINLSCYISKKVLKNFLVGLKIW